MPELALILRLFPKFSFFNIILQRYLWERYKDQKSIVSGEYILGSITLRCQMLREHLRVEVLNARHLKPPDPPSGWS